MTLKKIAMVFGVVFVAVGVLGFIPALNPDGKLLGLFAVNPAHNLVHVATGVVAIIVGFASDKASKIFFQVFGVVYAIVAVMGFMNGEQPLLGLVSNNLADTGLHVLVALLALYLGFMMRTEPTTTA